MMLESGYIKLVDMGSSKIIPNKGQPRTYTIIGTPHYMAP
jgi:cGMP-dependent protein kinase